MKMIPFSLNAKFVIVRLSEKVIATESFHFKMIKNNSMTEKVWEEINCNSI